MDGLVHSTETETETETIPRTSAGTFGTGLPSLSFPIIFRNIIALKPAVVPLPARSAGYYPFPQIRFLTPVQNPFHYKSSVP